MSPFLRLCRQLVDVGSLTPYRSGELFRGRRLPLPLTGKLSPWDFVRALISFVERAKPYVRIVGDEFVLATPRATSISSVMEREAQMLIDAGLEPSILTDYLVGTMLAECRLLKNETALVFSLVSDTA